jgi:hypothetical protein
MKLQAAFLQTDNLLLGDKPGFNAAYRGSICCFNGRACKPNKTRRNTLGRNNSMIFMPMPVDETILEIIIQHLINEELIKEAQAL